MNNDRKQTDDNVSKKQEFLRYTFCLNLQTTKVFSFSIQRQLRSFQKSAIRFIVLYLFYFIFGGLKLKAGNEIEVKIFIILFVLLIKVL